MGLEGMKLGRNERLLKGELTESMLGTTGPHHTETFEG